ncbi:MAG TPA: S-methyl-5-thioribose-1-phosphate isomerase [Methylococcaceae bacterium]|nr:S-methyl-5-thioribose-1-phosphate isomerase [Methylococcaceae bacterium]
MTNKIVQALIWKENGLSILDQRQLPSVLHYEHYTHSQGVAQAIATMQVRGAPAIGIAAAYGVVLSLKQHYGTTPAWRSAVYADIDLLANSRPTAVNLFWALDKMKAIIAQESTDVLAAATACAIAIHLEDQTANRKMGELGAEVIGHSKGLLTHCNTGSLATGGYGTALGVIRSVAARQSVAIYADETRPWLQGARLTVWELAQDGIPATLIADSAAAWLMKSGAIDWIIVGADRIASNGDTANKIGTYSLAVLAKQHGVKMMVVAPTSTIDWTLENGNAIEIELRDSSELLPESYHTPDSLVSAWNPVFDVTPATLIDALVTERGVVLAPSTRAEGIARLRNA